MLTIKAIFILILIFNQFRIICPNYIKIFAVKNFCAKLNLVTGYQWYCLDFYKFKDFNLWRANFAFENLFKVLNVSLLSWLCTASAILKAHHTVKSQGIYKVRG